MIVTDADRGLAKFRNKEAEESKCEHFVSTYICGLEERNWETMNEYTHCKCLRIAIDKYWETFTEEEKQHAIWAKNWEPGKGVFKYNETRRNSS